MQKTYLEELETKLYYTKGARFEAHDRLKRTAKLSMITRNQTSRVLETLEVFTRRSNCLEGS
ncbi:MAG: hypothetical protein RJQ14_27895 [Marinoscillum sp.]